MDGGILSPGVGDTFLNVDFGIEGGFGFSGMAVEPLYIGIGIPILVNWYGRK